MVYLPHPSSINLPILSYLKCVSLLNLEWIKNKVLMYSTGNYMQYPMINHNGKEYIKKNICVYNRVTLLYSRHWHNTVNQLYTSIKKINKVCFLQAAYSWATFLETPCASICLATGVFRPFT